MLQITIPSVEQWDEVNNVFVTSKEQTLQLEHSLVSISKWESKWKVPFIDERRRKTFEETIDYVRCMTITQNVDPNVYKFLTNKNMEEVNRYINDPMSATTINTNGGPKRNINGERLTSEVIYYQMITYGIPFECQKWHLERLLKLLQVCSIKNEKPKQMGMQERLSRQAQINAQRRKRTNSKG